MIAVYAVLIGGLALMLLNWRRPTVQVGGGELRAGPGRLQLAAVGEVSALDEAQTRSLRGPRGDPAAFLLIRPYLRQSVYVEVTTPAAVIPPAATSGAGDPARDGESRRWGRRPRQRASTMPAGAAAPYWLVCTRHPAELAAAINGARPAARADGAAVG